MTMASSPAAMPNHAIFDDFHPMPPQTTAAKAGRTSHVIPLPAVMNAAVMISANKPRHSDTIANALPGFATPDTDGACPYPGGGACRAWC